MGGRCLGSPGQRADPRERECCGSTERKPMTKGEKQWKEDEGLERPCGPSCRYCPTPQGGAQG